VKLITGVDPIYVTFFTFITIRQTICIVNY